METGGSWQWRESRGPHTQTLAFHRGKSIRILLYCTVMITTIIIIIIKRLREEHHIVERVWLW